MEEAPLIPIPIPIPPTSIPNRNNNNNNKNNNNKCELIKLVLGCIYGSVLGDAYGLSTECLNKEQVLKAYGSNAIPFPGFLKTSHNSRWPKGDWTDESDQMIIALDSLLETGGKFDECNFAKRLHKWVTTGFAELGDTCGLGSTASSIILQGQFTTNPYFVSEKTWIQTGRRQANNGAITRSISAGLFNHENLSLVSSNAGNLAKTTNFDQRCVTSNMAIACAISILLNNVECKKISISGTSIGGGPSSVHSGSSKSCSSEEVEHLIEEVVGKCATTMTTITERVEFEEILYNTSLESLSLSSPDSVTYVFKALGAGFWGLRSHYSFKDTLNYVIREGGDSDCNASLCGALLGCRLGYSQLPKDWLQVLPFKEWLDFKVVKLVDFLKRNRKN
ncbi:hypothetical protein DFA_03191 [Cavenderia fasciculata]|uniref:ADP-ribosylation/Crystallin J1 n=1 Tax=Cavenderia fasciculata TaxID=261658 RepID=F4PGW2_CACFS|nr:uncharacterized protein DFA_03191 [Cavenderia fasciculata]EGG24946.1 hypothetical protein DFA_03191 [Cavenderia fasciculata]|eukprot:XP_004362797.1 hypothetical protein DFA_03191 [Cavenderia fasciculata]